MLFHPYTILNRYLIHTFNSWALGTSITLVLAFIMSQCSTYQCIRLYGKALVKNIWKIFVVCDHHQVEGTLRVKHATQGLLKNDIIYTQNYFLTRLLTIIRQVTKIQSQWLKHNTMYNIFKTIRRITCNQSLIDELRITPQVIMQIVNTITYIAIHERKIKKQRWK